MAAGATIATREDAAEHAAELIARADAAEAARKAAKVWERMSMENSLGPARAGANYLRVSLRRERAGWRVAIANYYLSMVHACRRSAGHLEHPSHGLPKHQPIH